jgi:GT2 family glycosyltransferase
VDASVVIASHNRPERLRRLLDQLAGQDLPRGSFEVCVVDDGSRISIRPLFETRSFPYPLRIFEQENRGAAAARHRGALEARGRILLFVDDDMQLSAEFVRRHLSEHERERAVVLGRIAAGPELERMPLFERWHQHLLDRLARDFISGRKQPAGLSLFSGNVSIPREAYFAAGGFDPGFEQSEDIELGIRLERLGLAFRFAPEAVSLHCSDHTSLENWRRRARSYGRCDFRLSRAHSGVLAASPWRFLFELNPLARPPVAFALLSPGVAAALASAVLGGAALVDRRGLRALAYAGVTVAYMIEYFRGIRDALPSLRSALSEVWAYRRRKRQPVSWRSPGSSASNHPGAPGRPSRPPLRAVP